MLRFLLMYIQFVCQEKMTMSRFAVSRRLEQKIQITLQIVQINKGDIYFTLLKKKITILKLAPGL